eukprot:6400978-Prymnesium_polylepis.1
MLLLDPKPRSALEAASASYTNFSQLYNAGEHAEGWPLLAQLEWSLMTVQRSLDWAVRPGVDAELLPAVYDLQARLLDGFARWEDA